MSDYTEEDLAKAREWLRGEYHARATNTESYAAFRAEARREACAALDRIREHWPHIEVGIKGRTHDPGSPTCLRCTIEKEIADAGSV